MYFAIAQQMKKTLGNLDTILSKAERYAEGRKFDPGNFIPQRLAPDMFPFVRQVQVATDAAKAFAANCSGREVPKFDDNEKSFAELHVRLQKTIAFLDTLSAADFAKLTDDAPFPVMSMGKRKHMRTAEAALQRSIPNFFFHVTSAYVILRQGGVDIGKGDFLGSLQMQDA